MRRFVLLTACAALTLAGCQSSEVGQKEGMGTFGGAVIGGIIGSRFGGGAGKAAAVGIGALLGAMAGREMGASLDRADMAYAHTAYSTAGSAPVGQVITWRNPGSGNYGTVTPTRDGYDNSGRHCREFSQTVYIGGRPQELVDVACLNPDGSWSRG